MPLLARASEDVAGRCRGEGRMVLQGDAPEHDNKRVEWMKEDLLELGMMWLAPLHVAAMC